MNYKRVVWKAEVMYELADWGHPVAPPETTNREKLTTQLPHSLIRVLRSRARAQGVSLNVLVDRLLHEAIAVPARHEIERASMVAFD
jgi:predicted HicB family RNase H-like nuclease